MNYPERKLRKSSSYNKNKIELYEGLKKPYSENDFLKTYRQKD